MTTKDRLKEWLNEPRIENPTHMLVVCDTFDYEDYPVYVSKDQDVNEVYAKYHGRNMQKVMEVYDYSKDLEAQLNGDRVFNF